MSKSNPEKALAALIPAPIRAGSFTVQPMTLGMFAALERIGSPLVTGEDAKDTLKLIPSLYLLTHDPREIFAGNILDKAMEWANTVGVDAIGKIKAACDKQLKTLFDVIPETPADEKKKRPRRLDRKRRVLRRQGVRLELPGNPLGNPGLGHLPPPSPTGHPGGQNLPPLGN